VQLHSVKLPPMPPDSPRLPPVGTEAAPGAALLPPPTERTLGISKDELALLGRAWPTAASEGGPRPRVFQETAHCKAVSRPFLSLLHSMQRKSNVRRLSVFSVWTRWVWVWPSAPSIGRPRSCLGPRR
jgi:hypothetical protein